MYHACHWCAGDKTVCLWHIMIATRALFVYHRHTTLVEGCLPNNSKSWWYLSIVVAYHLPLYRAYRRCCSSHLGKCRGWRYCMFKDCFTPYTLQVHLDGRFHDSDRTALQVRLCSIGRLSSWSQHISFALMTAQVHVIHSIRLDQFLGHHEQDS